MEEAPEVLAEVQEDAEDVIWEVPEAIEVAWEALEEVPAVVWEAPEVPADLVVIVDMSTDPYRPVVIMEWDAARIAEDVAAAVV